MHTGDQKFVVKTRPQIFLAQNLIFFNGSTAFQFSRNPRKSSSMAFQFLQRLQNLIFFNGFPNSKKPSSTAFRFPRNPGKSIYGGKYTKDRYPSFVFQPKLR
jgi:hypothetical protein